MNYSFKGTYNGNFDNRWSPTLCLKIFEKYLTFVAVVVSHNAIQLGTSKSFSHEIKPPLLCLQPADDIWLGQIKCHYITCACVGFCCSHNCFSMTIQSLPLHRLSKDHTDHKFHSQFFHFLHLYYRSNTFFTCTVSCSS